MRMLSPKLRYWLAVAALAIVAMAIAAVVTDGPTFLSAQTAEPSVTAQTETAADVEMQRRFNELRSELLDERSDAVGRWLAAAAIFVTFFGVVIAIVGLVGFTKFRAEARKHVGEAEKSAQEARTHLEAIKEYRQESEEHSRKIREATSEDIQDPDKGKELRAVAQDVQRNPQASVLDKAIADAFSLQREGATSEAVEKWRAIANLAEGADDGLAARAWFSIGYLLEEKEQAIHAYERAIGLKPDYADAYNNRGVVKADLDRHERPSPTTIRRFASTQTTSKPTATVARQRPL